MAVFLIFAFAIPSYALSAKSAAVVEQTTGRLIFGENENERLPMASTTKIMTGLLAVESGKFDEVVTVPQEALRVEGSSMGLKPGEKITLRDLTYGLMLESGNDAANAIAIFLGGSIDGFVKRMNDRAMSLGLKDTQFVTPSGLDADGHYTTALDLARLGAYAMRNREFASVVSTKKIRVTYDGVKNGRVLCNHNRMLEGYDGAVGIKTGFTKKCGRCLVSCARRDGVSLVVCTLHDPDDWKDHASLLDSGFKLLQSRKLLNEPLTIAQNVVGGQSDIVEGRCGDEICAALGQGEESRVKMQIEMSRFVYAPVREGQEIGSVVFTLDGKEIARGSFKACGSVAQQPVPRKTNIFTAFWESIRSFFERFF